MPAPLFSPAARLRNITVTTSVDHTSTRATTLTRPTTPMPATTLTIMTCIPMLSTTMEIRHIHTMVVIINTPMMTMMTIMMLMTTPFNRLISMPL